MMTALEANADGLIGPTHSYAGLSPGNLASSLNKGEASNPRAAVLQGLEKMRLLADLGLPQYVLPPHERPFVPFLRSLGFAGTDAQVVERAWKDAPGFAAAANHVRLCAEHGAPGVNLLVWGREAYEAWDAVYPARQTREASEALAYRHAARGAVLARQGRDAIAGGTFHNDVVCVGALDTLLFHDMAFEDRASVEADIRRAADGLFEPIFVEVSSADLPLADAISSYLFNSMLIQVPGEDRLTLICPTETRDNPRSHAVAEGLAASNGPIGAVRYVDVRQSMRNGGGPACLRLRVALTEAEQAAANPAMRLTPELHARLARWAEAHYRDRLAPADLADPALLDESRRALDELTGILGLGGDFYPFQTT